MVAFFILRSLIVTLPQILFAFTLHVTSPVPQPGRSCAKKIDTNHSVSGLLILLNELHAYSCCISYQLLCNKYPKLKIINICYHQVFQDRNLRVASLGCSGSMSFMKLQSRSIGAVNSRKLNWVWRMCSQAHFNDCKQIS